MLMISHANTNPGLTKAWDPGEPDEVLPDRRAQLRPHHRHRRLPGRGRRTVRQARTSRSRSACVLNDAQTYGVGVATAFTDEAKKQGIEIVGERGLGRQAAELHRVVRGLQGSQSPDCVYLGGINDNNGEQLIRTRLQCSAPTTAPSS